MKNKSTRREFLELNAALLTSTTFAASGVSLVHAASRRDKYRVFSKGRIASLTLKNRLVRSATAEGASPKGQMNKDGLTMYEHLAAGGVGMIITGHMVAVRGGDAHENQTHIDDDRYISTLREIADVVHHNGADCKLIAQLSHAGPNGMVDPIAASEMPGRPNGKKPRTLSITEISDLIAQYSAAVRQGSIRKTP